MVPTDIGYASIRGMGLCWKDAGFGASLQHYNPLIDEAVAKQWHINPNWKLIAEMPFGTSTRNREKNNSLH